MHRHVNSVEFYTIIPFILMLCVIAVGPIIFPHKWEKNGSRLFVSLLLGVPTSIFLIIEGYLHELTHQMLFDYIPFIILLGGLFIITGGMRLVGFIPAKPAMNTLVLSIGAILASFMGTTGAAMLLIRPVLTINLDRKYKIHTVLFFIAIVANCGGLLTPLGDPPLFLLYLRGVPFNWFFTLLPEWLFINCSLLVIYYFIDLYYFKKKEKIQDVEHLLESKLPVRMKGKKNLIFLGGVIFAVAFLNQHYIPAIEIHPYLTFIREAVIITMAILSLIITKKNIRISNNYRWEPIIEVAYLFLGIFITMTPALLYLQQNATYLGLTNTKQFYFITGSLSSFLDNAPTAVSMFSLAQGLQKYFEVVFINESIIASIPVSIIKAISIGAVFFGSMTYIGNGPNFMVKAIAENNNINMPHFFKYMYTFSLIILLPLFIIAYLIFI